MESPAPKASLAPRTQRYQVVERLGQGGMAVVFRAVDNDLRRWCALKVLLPEFRDDPTARARFRAEAEAMIRLRHRNLMEVWDAQVDGDVPFFAMELATGGCVVDWVQRHGPMPPRMAVDVVIQVCKGLRAAHDKGIVHRDVKPHNILVNRRGVCKLTDFGIARHEDVTGLTMDGRGIGTLGFIAPEQKNPGSTVDHRADIYSVGATLHSLLRGETTLNLYLAEQEPQMLDGIPAPLRAPIVKATRYRPEDRYASISELARALFQAKAALPEDPPDTPPLVLEGAGVSEEDLNRFVSNPAASDLVDDTPEFAGDMSTSSLPSIDRRSLLREAPTLDAGPARILEEMPAWARIALAAGAALLLCAALVLAALVTERDQALQRSADAVNVRRTQLAEVLDEDGPALVDEIGLIGGDRAEVDALLGEAGRARGYDLAKAAHRLAVEADEEVKAHYPPEASSTIHAARRAEARVKRIEERVEDLAHTERADAAIRTGPIGRITTALGLGAELSDPR